MNGQVDVFTLLTLVVAVVAIFKLISVLGRRTGDEETRIEQRARDAAAREPTVGRTETAQPDKVVTLRRRDAPAGAQPVQDNGPVPADDAGDRIRALTNNNAAASKGLFDIVAADPGFDPDQFIKGAKAAYEMIVVAFADGNRKALRDLLGPSVYESFAAAITEREKRGEKIEQTFIGLNKADILEAEVDKGSAQITMRFLSELITATRDKSGSIVSGDLELVKGVTDLWTFSRDISTAAARRNLNWKLIGTEPVN